MAFGELDATRRETAKKAFVVLLCIKAGIDGRARLDLVSRPSSGRKPRPACGVNVSLMALARLPGSASCAMELDISPWFYDARRGRWRRSGRAAWVALPADVIVKRTLNFNRNAPPQLIPSMAVDLLRGNRIELPWLSGKVVELGKKHQVPTPTHAFMHAMLKPYTMGTPAKA